MNKNKLDKNNNIYLIKWTRTIVFVFLKTKKYFHRDIRCIN